MEQYIIRQSLMQIKCFSDFVIWLLFNCHFSIISEMSVSSIYSDVKVLASSL